MLSFTVTCRDGDARTGILRTPHGEVETPAFIFCATKAAMKAVTMEQMRTEGTQIILSNTYHLMLQPGSETVHRLGGLQKFTGWHGPMLTDSGGFQIFSLGHGSVADEVKGRRNMAGRNKSLVKIDETGAVFKSYVNGKTVCLTPELAMKVQMELGADLIVVLDECTPFHVEKEYTRLSMERSHRWAKRCLKFINHFSGNRQGLYGIIQGGIYRDLRQESCDFVNHESFFGNAVGGSLGKDKQQMHDVVARTMESLNRERPTHLLGIGGLGDILNGVAAGIDTFDCVHPSRLARHGGALVLPGTQDTGKAGRDEHINLRNSRYREDSSPIDPDCSCATCRNYSKGYLHHLLKAGEMAASTLITIHNVFFMNKFMENIRKAIKSGQFARLRSARHDFCYNDNDGLQNRKGECHGVKE